MFEEVNAARNQFWANHAERMKELDKAQRMVESSAMYGAVGVDPAQEGDDTTRRIDQVNKDLDDLLASL